jgi:hypothetical protein
MTPQPPDFKSLALEAMDENTLEERLQKLASYTVELARLVASNTIAPPELLEKLSRRRDIVIRQNVASNPNTSTEVLFKLGKKFPEQFLKNPIFPLLLLENPNFLNNAPLSTLESLLEYTSQPPEKNIETANCKVSIPELCLQQLAEHEDIVIRYCIAKYPNTPIYLLEQLAKDDTYVRKHVALNPSTPIYLLEELARDVDTLIRQSVARNSNAPIYVLENLADDEDLHVRSGVAKNHKAPAYILERLGLKNNQASILTAVGENPNTPAYILEKLIKNDAWEVRKSVARNSKAPAYILVKMVQVNSEKWMVLKAIAKNPNTPITVLDKLAGDRRKVICVTAIDNLDSRKVQDIGLME